MSLDPGWAEILLQDGLGLVCLMCERVSGSMFGVYAQGCDAALYHPTHLPCLQRTQVQYKLVRAMQRRSLIRRVRRRDGSAYIQSMTGSKLSAARHDMDGYDGMDYLGRSSIGISPA